MTVERRERLGGHAALQGGARPIEGGPLTLERRVVSGVGAFAGCGGVGADTTEGCAEGAGAARPMGSTMTARASANVSASEGQLFALSLREALVAPSMMTASNAGLAMTSSVRPAGPKGSYPSRAATRETRASRLKQPEPSTTSSCTGVDATTSAMNALTFQCASWAGQRASPCYQLARSVDQPPPNRVAS
jgi:hypothetical protein